MGLKRLLLRVRAIDYLISVLALIFISGILVLSLQISGRNLRNQRASPQAKGIIVQDALPSGRRMRRDTSWSVPDEVYQISLNVPEDCSRVNPLPEFPNATCFSLCKSSSCDSDGIDSVQSGKSQLVCTARILQFGFQHSGTGEISTWIKKHPDVTARYSDIFVDRRREPVLDVCPVEQLHVPTAAWYFEPYSMSSVGSHQQLYYLHCEHCLTISHVDYYFGKLFLDLPTAMFPLISSPNQKYVITIKNPTDRAIAEYFYPYKQDGTNLTSIGGETLHNAMVAAIAQAKDCMISHGPTACVYGHNTVYRAPVLAEAQMLYDSCYSTHMKQVLSQIGTDQTYFVKVEEYSASSSVAMQDIYSFLGLDYVEPPPTAPSNSAPQSKPFRSDTIRIMDAFFAPFNRELSDMLGDDKWLYIR